MRPGTSGPFAFLESMDTITAVALLVLVGLVAVLVGLPGIVVGVAVLIIVAAWALPRVLGARGS